MARYGVMMVTNKAQRFSSTAAGQMWNDPDKVQPWSTLQVNLVQIDLHKIHHAQVATCAFAH